MFFFALRTDLARGNTTQRYAAKKHPLINCAMMPATMICVPRKVEVPDSAALPARPPPMAWSERQIVAMVKIRIRYIEGGIGEVERPESRMKT